MAVQDRYNLLCRAVTLANSPRLPYSARIKALLDLLAKEFQLTYLSLFIFDKERRNLTRRISAGRSRPNASCCIPFGEGASGRCASEKTTLFLSADQCHPDELPDPAVRKIAAVPVREEGDVCGVVILGKRDPDDLALIDFDLLQAILVEVAGLIRRIRLSEASGNRIHNLTILNQLGLLLNRLIPLSSLVPLILQNCHELTGSCAVFLRFIPQSGMPAGLFRKVVRKTSRFLPYLLDIESASSQRVLENDIPLLVCDLLADVELPPSYICVPLKFEGKMLGTLTFFGKHHEGVYSNYDEEERELFEGMGILISNALASALNYQEMVQLSAENDKKIKEGFLLYRISNTMLSTIRVNKLIHLILTALTSGNRPFFDRAMLFLINQRARVMQGMLGVTRETAHGLINPVADLQDIQASRWDITEEDIVRQRDSDFSSRVRSCRLELDRLRNVASRAVLDKKAIFVADATKEKRVDKDFIRNFNINSFAVAPLMAKEQVVGVVVVDNGVSGKAISRDDLRFLQLFTNQAGMAIENSMLYNRIEDTNRSLREAQERLIQGERLATIGEMAAGIAHELKSPLISIGGFARRLERRLSAGSAELEYADTIVKEVQRLEKMLNDILSFTKKTTICYTHCNINEIIEDSLAIAAMALEECSIKVIKRYPRQVITFLGDCQQLKQVFINLLFNAQEAIKNGGQINITVSSTKLNGKDAVSAKVADSGGGIPLEALHNIFNPFYTTKETGTGLGLPIANRIVTNHGGKIQVSNHIGKGVEFNVILPCNQ